MPKKNASKKISPSLRHYYADEAGDGILFDRKGHVLIGKPGCSNYFILGFIDIPNADLISLELEAIRRSLLSDPYFKNVPSMQPEARKTALAFHAKDDIPEIRREVFSLLERHKEIRFFAEVREKRKVLEYVRLRSEHGSLYRYNPNELYDYLVRRLFKNQLHKHDAYKIYFAKRGKADRTEALRKALEVARQRFVEQWNIPITASVQLVACTPPKCPGLQVADYFLWALQRLYEHREQRYVNFLWHSFRLVHDIDDTREAQYGVYYTQKRPLTVAALEERI